MLKTKMYVRCPADQESMYEPRIFVCGQIINIDEFKRTVSVKVHDPFGHLLFFEDLPKGVIELPLGSVDRCSFFIGSIVVYKGSSYKVLSCQKCKDDYYKYYIQNFDDTSVVKVPEADVIAAFNNGQVDPCVQLKNYEFQNPAWYLGRAVVAKSMDILENSIYGFKELAGSKIYLMPHQVNTIMRCLQESPCRYMLADEVGMGKTIEAISVYKIYTMNQSNKKALIVVPQVLKEQWISELLLKFNIPNGMGKNNNSVTVKTLQELSEKDLFTDWDFVIVDEVHKYLFSQSEYEKLHKISTLAKNILLLSATPVQQKKEEYLDLLRLLLPQKYNSFSVEKFGKLIAKQSKIIQKTALILDDLGDFEEEINSLAESAHDSEECEELFEEIHEDLEEICDELDDDKLNELLQQIKYENDDLGVYTIKVIISYICSNYQIESNIIRNRRKILESTDEDVQLMASRDLIELTYLTDNEGNPYEQLSYNVFAHWIIKGLESGILDVELDIKPLLSRFFSSPWAFYKQAKSSKMDGSILDNIRKWLESEQFNVDHINDILDDPDKYADSYASRLVIVINALYLSFENVIDEMICEAWHTVTHYHLRLGPTVNGNAANFLEHAINTLNNTVSDLSQNPSKEELKQAISECEKELKRDKTRLTDYVPYKLLYPFFDVEGMEEELSYIKNDKHSRLIAYMAKLSGDENLFYTILDGVGLQKKIRMNPYWRKFLLQNFSVIQRDEWSKSYRRFCEDVSCKRLAGSET